MEKTPQPRAELIVDADAPVEAFSDDKFSFGPLARGIARQLIKYDRPTTFAVGDLLQELKTVSIAIVRLTK